MLSAVLVIWEHYYKAELSNKRVIFNKNSPLVIFFFKSLLYFLFEKEKIRLLETLEVLHHGRMKGLQRNLGYLSMKETCTNTGTVMGYGQNVPRYGCGSWPHTRNVSAELRDGCWCWMCLDELGFTNLSCLPAYPHFQLVAPALVVAGYRPSDALRSAEVPCCKKKLLCNV